MGISLANRANLGVRHTQVALLFFLLLLANAFRVNISLAIVAMIDPETTNAEVMIDLGIISSFILLSDSRDKSFRSTNGTRASDRWC